MVKLVIKSDITLFFQSTIDWRSTRVCTKSPVCILYPSFFLCNQQRNSIFILLCPVYVYYVCTGQAVCNIDGANDTFTANVYKNGAVKSRAHQIDLRISFIRLRTCNHSLSIETRR